MKALVLAGALALGVSSSASAALLIDIHAEGNAFGTIPGVIYGGAPIIVDGTFDLTKGTRLTGPISDAVGGSGANAPGLADVSLELLEPSAGWGSTFSVLQFTHTPGFSAFDVLLRDATNTYLLRLSGSGAAGAFASLDTPPVGNVCSAMRPCLGAIQDPDGGSVMNKATLTWSTITFSVRDTAAVPEPSTWALMILGFGLAGAMLRRGAKVRAHPVRQA